MIQVGVLGTAHGHVMSYGGEWLKHPEYGVKIIGVWDHDAQRCANSAKTLEARAYDTAEALLASEIAAVVISSETLYHTELVEKAADAGKDIILYKPMALTLKEADRIVEAVERNNVRFTMGWQMRVDPQNIEMKKIVNEERLGKVCLYRRRHCLATHTWGNFADTWHASPALNRDIFADDSAHPIDMMQWIFGMPETVTCELSSMLNPRVPNDNGVALFRYANGLIAEITCSFTCNAAESTTEIYCERGSVQQYFGDAPATRLPRPEMPGLKWYVEGDADWTDSAIPSPAQHGERLKAQALPFAEFLRGERASICSAREGRDSLRLVLACYLSAREGARVSVYDDRIYEI